MLTIGNSVFFFRSTFSKGECDAPDTGDGLRSDADRLGEERAPLVFNPNEPSGTFDLALDNWYVHDIPGHRRCMTGLH